MEAHLNDQGRRVVDFEQSMRRAIQKLEETLIAYNKASVKILEKKITVEASEQSRNLSPAQPVEPDGVTPNRRASSKAEPDKNPSSGTSRSIVRLITNPIS